MNENCAMGVYRPRLRRRLAMAAGLLFLLNGSLFATTYYFSVSGNDGNAGTDPLLPKKSLAAAAALALPGNTLLFKRGDAWYNPFASFDLRNKSGLPASPVTIDAYGSGDKPIIAALSPLDDAGWTNVAGTNTWQHAVTGYSDAFRLFEDGVSKYKVNTTNASANETAVDQPYEWYIKPVTAGAAGIVYVNTGSPVIAPVHVEVHPLGAVSTLLMQNSHFINVHNIDFRGGSQYNVVYVESPSSDIAFDSCIIREAMGSGLLVTNLTTNTATYVSNIRITNNLLDKVWTTYENDPAIPALTGDGIFILHAVDTGLVSGNTVRNWGHVGITLSSYSFGFHGVHHIVVEQNDVTAGASGYMHALDVDGFEGYTTNNVIRRNYFHDYTSTVHAQGNNNFFYSNIFAGVRLTTQPKQSQQPYGMDLIPWKYTDGHWMAAHDNYIVNNTIADCASYPIVISDDPTSTSVVGNNIIANNIVYKFGSVVGLNITPAVRGSVYVQHNDIWNFSATAGIARYKSNPPYYTCPAMDSVNPAFCAGDVQADPRFVNFSARDFHLSDSAMASLRSGGTSAYATLLGAGFTDYYGTPWDSAHPSMGAIQYRGPADSIVFSPVLLPENRPAATVAGSLLSASSDPTAVFSYALVAGAGDADNGLFAISGNQVVTAAALDYEQKAVYNLRVRSTSQYGFSLDKQLTVLLTDVNEAPVISAVPGQQLCYTQDQQMVMLSGISAGPESSQSTALSVRSDNDALFDLLEVNMLTNGNGYLKYRIRNGQAGTANVIITVKDDGGTANGGVDSAATAFGLTVNPLPVINIGVSRIDPTNTGEGASTIVLGYGAQQLYLSASAAGAAAFTWYPATGLSNTAVFNPVFAPDSAGVYTPKVYVVNTFGCAAVDSVALKVIDARCGKKGDKVSVCFGGTGKYFQGIQVCVAPAVVPVLLRLNGQLGACTGSASMDLSNLSAEIKQVIAASEDRASLLVYPNPSAGRSTVSFTVPTTQTVGLDVYDTRGKLVKPLYKGRVQGGEMRSVDFVAGNLSSGVYIVRLTTMEGTENTQLILIK